MAHTFDKWRSCKSAIKLSYTAANKKWQKVKGVIHVNNVSNNHRENNQPEDFMPDLCSNLIKITDICKVYSCRGSSSSMDTGI